ncbi:hypothetical protein [Methylobacterium sp. yr668]|uniref:hypothetical protein n=1 Tax=Methylobacterium sp. yr668 TaxID=1761801 RepID=UPI0008EE775F|nr:hypothetical protein [Methylobacterium sp. yr668]SFT28253.1 hypothetical protein SAMN04487845_14419 [Methylobacterium sp. yr668]
MTVVDDVLFEAVHALRACGYAVEPWSNDYPLWLINRETFADGAVIVLALRLGLMDGPERLQ